LSPMSDPAMFWCLTVAIPSLISQAAVAVSGLAAVWLAVWIDRAVAAAATRRAQQKGPDAEASDPLTRAESEPVS